MARNDATEDPTLEPAQAKPRAPRQRKQATKPKGPQPLNPEAVQAWQGLLTLLLGAPSLIVGQAPMVPNPQEISRLVGPAARVFARRWEIPEVPESANDYLAAGIGVASYLVRAFGARSLGRASSSAAAPSSTPPPPEGVAYTPRPVPAAPPQPAPERPAPRPNAAPGTTEQAQQQAAERWARPGEGVGIPAADMSGPPEEVLRKLHNATFREGQ